MQKWADWGRQMNERYIADDKIKADQWLRMRRFGLAAVTYGVVILMTALVTRLGLGELSPLKWFLYVGLAVLINSILFLLFRTGVNLRFPEPSLTREQIILSALWGMIPLYSLSEARPIILMFFLPPFSFGMLRLNRKSYLMVVVYAMGLYAALLIAEYLLGRPGFRPEYEIFLYMIYGILLTWFSVFGGYISDIRERLGIQNRKIQKASELIRTEMEERKRAEAEKDRLIVDLQEALERIETLSGLLPICASCKRIRDDKGDWKPVETYIRAHSNAEFSHGICPECSKKLYPEYNTGKIPDDG